MGPTPGYTIRPITPADEPFLWEALYHAIYVAPGDVPPERDVVNRPALARYVHGWGDANDLGFIAVAGEPATNRRSLDSLAGWRKRGLWVYW